jgi:hypothetical protein
VRNLDVGADDVRLRYAAGRVALGDEARQTLAEDERPAVNGAGAVGAPEIRVGPLRERDGVEHDRPDIVLDRIRVAPGHVGGERPLSWERDLLREPDDVVVGVVDPD